MTDSKPLSQTTRECPVWADQCDCPPDKCQSDTTGEIAATKSCAIESERPPTAGPFAEDIAPKPWTVSDSTNGLRGFISILDASGGRVCDLFPFAGADGRGYPATIALAFQIVEAVNRRFEFEMQRLQEGASA